MHWPTISQSPLRHGMVSYASDDIRPDTGEISANPTLSSAETHVVFLGYAINMLHITCKSLAIQDCLPTHALRETLFYRLLGPLGDLQVYTDRDCMNMAISCINITTLALSIDGLIMRGFHIMALVLDYIYM